MTLTVMVGIVFALALYYPVRYAFAKPWRNPVGRAAFTFSVILAVVLGLTFARRTGWVQEFSPPFVLAIYGAILFGLAYQDFVLTRALMQRRPDDHVSNTDEEAESRR